MTSSRKQKGIYSDFSDDDDITYPEERPVSKEDTYAARTARTPLREELESVDRDEESARVNATRSHVGQFRYILDFEKEHFHPLNVMPDRPCTAYFKAGTELTAKDFFDSFVRDGIAASAVRCLQRKPTGEVEVTFTNPEHCLRFLDQSSFIFRRRSYPVHPTSGFLSFISIYDFSLFSPYMMLRMNYQIRQLSNACNRTAQSS